ncbi:MAG: DUF1553 domain-containing protein [Planctomycetaceae bacterium]
MLCRWWKPVAAACIGLAGIPGVRAQDRARAVQFGRDIRPILSDVCFKCHGPDKETRQADLRLDVRDAAFAERESGAPAIVPGRPDASELYLRITAHDPAERMPPESSEKSLSPAHIALFRQWIAEGARWEEHWAFVPPRATTPPAVQNEPWVRNAIDRFVLNRLEAEGLQPAPEADKRRLIRRVTLDLTGLPPTPAQVDAFLADESPAAYESLVDSLLSSSRFGERMALDWLDAARYADTHGYTFDTERFMWRWRDWVIDAFNRNLPFDQFTLAQLAGDLLPEATTDQRIASGFNRNHMVNSEFGAIEREYFVENVADRVNTTATVWMGLTMACARCHDHKYDPISQQEFYELFSFFGNIAETGLDGMWDNAGPKMAAPTPDQTQRLLELKREVEQAQKLIGELEAQIAAGQAAWESEFREPFEDVRDGLLAHWPFDRSGNDASGNGLHTGDQVPYGHGLLGGAVTFNGLNSIRVMTGRFDHSDAFAFAAWIHPLAVQGRRSVFMRMPEGITLNRGYGFQIHDGRLALLLIHQFPDSRLEVESDAQLATHKWQHVAASYDGSGSAAGVRLYVNGRRQPLRVIADSLGGTIEVPEALKIGDGTPSASFRGQIDEARIYRRALADDEVSRLPGLSIHSLLAIAADERNADQARIVREYFLDHVAPPGWRKAHYRLAAKVDEQARLERAVSTVMVMQELQEKPRVTHILTRGAYDQPQAAVTAGTPRFLPPLRDDLPRNRLGLARWLVEPEHPLTARVTVNRFWQMYFGAGLVRTVEDFGSQGEPPSHPELLDWLALEFIRSGWDVKAMQRLIVTSAVYRQSSRVPAEPSSPDPDNRLLSRGPRLRLDAEFIRDQALALAGLLVERIGGPSVKPYQPAGIWEEGAFDPTGNRWSAQSYIQDHGQALYRRSLYTFWKRTAPPPAMLAFDAPERERCVVRRSRTNTPLQALVTMNDVTFVEASRKLAERMMREGGSDPQSQIQFAFRLATAREPTPGNLAPLLGLYEKQHKRFADDPQAAAELLAVGESAVNAALSPIDLAACTAVASVILNLDEVLTK